MKVIASKKSLSTNQVLVHNKPSQRDNFKLAPVASLLILASLKVALLGALG